MLNAFVIIPYLCTHRVESVGLSLSYSDGKIYERPNLPGIGGECQNVLPCASDTALEGLIFDGF
jgi:hypothetical protein